MTIENKVEVEVTRFFEHFRGRLAAVEQLQTPSTVEMTPDQHILLGAALETLSAYWSRTTLPKDISSGSLRMDAFLAKHGPQPFKRVSSPALRELLAANSKALMILDKLAPRIASGTVQRWTKAGETLTLAAALAPAGVSAKDVKKQSFGAILYREHRCAWLHSSDQGGISSDPSFGNDPCHVFRNGVPTLTLPAPFLIQTLGSAIDGFEVECQTSGLKGVVLRCD